MKEQQNGQPDTLLMDVEKTNKENSNSELIERTEIENSPFTIIKTKGMYFGVMGQYRLTEPNDNKETIEKELKELTWNRIIQVTLLLIESMKEQELSTLMNKNNKK